MKIYVTLLGAVCLVTCVAGCSDAATDAVSTAPTVDFVNTLCPIMGNPINTKDPSMVKDWNGRKVGFCCPPCLEEWDELTEAEKSERIAHPPKDGESSHDHGDPAQTDHDQANHDQADKKESAPAP